MFLNECKRKKKSKLTKENQILLRALELIMACSTWGGRETRHDQKKSLKQRPLCNTKTLGMDMTQALSFCISHLWGPGGVVGHCGGKRGVTARLRESKEKE